MDCEMADKGMSEIVAVGACVTDTLLTVPEFPAENTKLRALDTRRAGGGPAATGLVAAAKLGAKCAFIGSLADDESGRFLRADFLRYGVDVSGIGMRSGFRPFSSVVLLSRASATRTCVFDKGTMPPLTLSDAQKRIIRNARLLMTDGNELDAAVEAARIAKQNGVKVLCDAGGLYPGVEKLLALTDILIPSEEFALAHTGEPDAAAAAKKLCQTYRSEAVVVTRGKEGGLLYENGRLTQYPIYPAEVDDSNGAGDVFHGAFAAGVVRGFSYEKCCHFASAVSALKCTGVGARESAPDYDTVSNYLRRNGYEL